MEPRNIQCPKCGSLKTYSHSGLISIGAGRRSSLKENVDLECGSCGFRGEVEVDMTKPRPDGATLEFIKEVLENCRSYLRDATHLLEQGAGLYDEDENQATYDAVFGTIQEGIWRLLNE